MPDNYGKLPDISFFIARNHQVFLFGSPCDQHTREIITSLISKKQENRLFETCFTP